MPSWSEIAKEKGIRYFLISFVDLFGTMRAKIVPATAIDGVAKSGAGFAGFATWFDMTPADPDVLVMPEQDSLWLYFGYAGYFVLRDDNGWDLERAQGWLHRQFRW